ncbi:MAG: hypothetical protein AABW99_02650, partial [archaeon]
MPENRVGVILAAGKSIRMGGVKPKHVQRIDSSKPRSFENNPFGRLVSQFEHFGMKRAFAVVGTNHEDMSEFFGLPEISDLVRNVRENNGAINYFEFGERGMPVEFVRQDNPKSWRATAEAIHSRLAENETCLMCFGDVVYQDPTIMNSRLLPVHPGKPHLTVGHTVINLKLGKFERGKTLFVANRGAIEVLKNNDVPFGSRLGLAGYAKLKRIFRRNGGLADQILTRQIMNLNRPEDKSHAAGKIDNPVWRTNSKRPNKQARDIVPNLGAMAFRAWRKMRH